MSAVAVHPRPLCKDSPTLVIPAVRGQLETTARHTHVATNTTHGVRSPLDALWEAPPPEPD